MAKVSKPIVYLVVLAIGALAYTYLGGGSQGTKSSIGVASRSAKKAKVELYLKEDYETHFARLAGPTKNSFEPIVARTTAGVTGVGPDAVPFDMAGGDPNWVFTGVSEVNGAKTVLFENRATMESEFANVGERWKNCTIGNADAGKVTLSSHTGKRVQLRLAEQSDQLVMNAPRGNGLAPLNPALSGPINGRPVAIRPEGERTTNRGRSTQEQSNAN